MTETATREVIFGKKQSDKADSSEFRRSLAIVIGIDCYSNGIPPLTTAVNDASRLARILETQHDYSVTLLAEDVTKSRLEAVFKEQKNNLSENDRLLVYFAGHGVALEGDNGPAGFLIPQDATLEEDSFWPMTELHNALDELPCRHVLIILDCCFAGTFRWSSKRDFQPLPSVMYRERYERFLRSSAWQVVTSAAHNQKALDVLCGNVVGERGHGFAQKESQSHSPFALSLFEALKGAADLQNDGVVTATELYIYLRDQVEVNAEQLASHQQTPGLWPLNKHRHGEFIFLVPGGKVDLPPAPDLTEKNNPYKGLSPYEADDSKLFFGRTALIQELQQKVEEQPFTVVLGASGTGKSSLVKAGLIPSLKSTAAEQNQEVCWRILPVMRPGAAPLAVLRSLLIKELPGVRPERKEGAAPAGLIGQWSKKNSGRKLLLVIDQFEELITLCRQEQERQDFIRELRQALATHGDVLRIVLTLRSDFQAQISQNYLKDWWQEENRFVVPPMTQNELREVIEQPASVMVLYFEPHALIDHLINEVIQTPGALPLLSFTLSELYLRYVARQKDVEQEEGDRALTEADYEEIGGVIGSLRRRIDQEYESLDDAHKATMRRILLRMVAFEGGGLTRRRVPRWELEYPDAAETERVNRVVAQLSQARLIVEGSSEKAGGVLEKDVEPAHDALIVAWDKLLQWRAEEAENMLLHRQLTRAAADWEDSAGAKDRDGLLWDSSPRLLRVQEILEQKWSRSKAVPTAGQKSFRGLRQFWRVLFPTFKHLEQHIWLNRVETDFVRRSVEKKRNWTRRVSVIIVTVIAVLSAITILAKKNEREAIHQIAMNYWNNGFNEHHSHDGSSIKALHYFAKSEGKFNFIKNKINNQFVSNARFVQSDIQQEFHLIQDIGIDRAIFNPDGSMILIFNKKGEVYVLDANLNKILFSIKKIPPVNRVQFNFDGSKMILWNDKKQIAYVFSGDTGIFLFSLKQKKPITKVDFSLDGKKILTWNENDNYLYIWNTITKNISKIINYNNNISGAIFAKTDNIILIWNKEHGKIHVFNIIDNKLSIISDNEIVIYKVLRNKCNDSILTVAHEGVKIWRNINKNPEFTNVEGGDAIFSNDGSRILTWWDQEETINILKTNTGASLSPTLKHKKPFSGARFGGAFFSHDDKRILTWSRDGTIYVWDGHTDTPVTPVINHKGIVHGALFNNKGDRILTWGEDGAARIFDSNTGNMIAFTLLHNENITYAKFSADDSKILTISENNIRVWKIKNTKNKVYLLEDKKSIKNIILDNQGNRVLIQNNDGKFYILDVTTGKLLLNFNMIITNAIFNNNGRCIFTWDHENKINILDGNNGKVLFNFRLEQEKNINTIILNDDNEIFLTLNTDGTARVWDIKTGKALSTEFKDKNRIITARFKKNSKKILTLSENEKNIINIWNSSDGKKISIPILEDKNRQIVGAIFNNDGSRILTWSTNWSRSFVRIFDTSNGKAYPPILEHDASFYRGILTGMFNKDESHILTWSESGEARVWDHKTGMPLTPILKHQDGILGAKFNSDESLILTWTRDNIQIWETNTGNRLFSLKTKNPTRDAKINAEGNRIFMWSNSNEINIIDIDFDNKWPSEKILLKIEVESGTKMLSTGEIQALSTIEWQNKKCEYDKIKYKLDRINKEQWNISQRACRQFNSSEAE